MDKIWIIDSNFEEDENQKVKAFSSREKALPVYTKIVKKYWNKYGPDVESLKLDDCLEIGEYTASTGDFGEEAGVYMYSTEVDR